MSFTKRFPQNKSNQSFASQIKKQKALVYVLNLTFPEGSAWYVFEVIPAKRKEFEEKFIAGVAIELTDYGAIHHSDWGDEPPESLKPELRDKYRLYEDTAL